MTSEDNSNLLTGPSRSGQQRSDVDEKAYRRLMAGVARGEEVAFGQLYQQLSPIIHNYLLRLIHEQALAEDLLQETFMAVWQGAGSYRRSARVRTWVLRIAHNKAVSWLRRHRPESLDENLEIASEQAGPERLLVTSWRNEELLKSLEQLSPNHRAVVELVFVHELSYAEIAEIMACPIGTVKSRVSYALQHLGRLLSNSEVGTSN